MCVMFEFFCQAINSDFLTPGEANDKIFGVCFFNEDHNLVILFSPVIRCHPH